MVNFNLLIMGGDARYLEVIKKLSNKKINIYLIGFDQLQFRDSNIKNLKIDEVDFSMMDAISIPVAGVNDEGKVEIVYSASEPILSIEEMKKMPKHCVIYTGTATPFIKQLSKSANRQLITLFAQDDIAILNSIATAEGVLKLTIENTDITIHGSDVIVLGFGRVGMTVARLFSSMGAMVSVCVRDSAQMARVTEMGLTPVHLNDLESVIYEMDTCINTIPYPLINKKVISAMNHSTFIIDIASDPGGTDFVFAKKMGYTALHALGLPGKTAPKSAGIIIANALAGFLHDTPSI